MLCSVVYIVVSAYLELVNIVILLPNPRVEAALPPGAEDEIVLIEHLPGRRVHLQDFFWTSADDAPAWLDPDQTLTLYETRTVHHTATVYLPDEGKDNSTYNADEPKQAGPDCTSCIEPTPTLMDTDQDIGVLIGDDPGPRYWLLTVLRAGESVPSKIELRLARLYRAAFSRQQERHLGLLTTDVRVRRATRSRALRQKRLERIDEVVTGTESLIKMLENFTTTTESSVETTLRSSVEVKRMRSVRIPRSKDISESGEEKFIIRGESSSDVIAEESEQRVARLEDDFTKDNVTEKILSGSGSLIPVELEEATNVIANKTVTTLTRSSGFKGRSSRPLYSLFSTSKRNFRYPYNISETLNATRAKLTTLDVAKVQIRMQNTSVIEGGATRLIYSVHLGGKPVPATSAARDMALLSEQEVALELGAPVIIQSEPYLKETRPLALSRKRDAWLLVGAAGAGVILLIFVLTGLILAARRKKVHNAVDAPPPQSILKKDKEHVPTASGFDNTGYTSETEVRTDGTSQRQTPGSQSVTSLTPGTPDSVVAEVHEVSSDNEDDLKRRRTSTPWDGEEYFTTVKKIRTGRRRVTRTNAVDPPRTPDSMDTVVGDFETLENGYAHHEEVPTSPYSYLSMPSCKQFPRIRSVEPLSRVLEPVVVKHLDRELDSPETLRRNNDYNIKDNEKFLERTPSAINDPGVVGPIVWDLRRQRAIEDTYTSETDLEPSTIPGPVGRARRRLHELLDDSFSLFGSRDLRFKASTSLRPPSATHSPFSETRGKSATVSPVATPTTEVKARPRTSLLRRDEEEVIPETGTTGPHPRGAWGSRPLSAGPFHRPNLPEVDTRRVLADSELPPEDPAVPLIAAIKKELGKFATQPS